MKTKLNLLAIALFTASICYVNAQFGGGGPTMPSGPKFTGAMGKLFGENTAFTANSEIQLKRPSGQITSMPSKTVADSGKSRSEINFAEIKGGEITPAMLEQIKSMGMDRAVTISRPDKKLLYMIYPGIKAYIEMPIPDTDGETADADYKVEKTELGKDAVENQATVKNKVVITDAKGKSAEFITWNAPGLKNFPLKIEMIEQGNTMTTVFKDVKFAKPDASLFEPPAGYTRYTDIMGMVQGEMMKKMGEAGAVPPGN